MKIRILKFSMTKSLINKLIKEFGKDKIHAISLYTEAKTFKITFEVDDLKDAKDRAKKLAPDEEVYTSDKDNGKFVTIKSKEYPDIKDLESILGDARKQYYANQVVYRFYPNK